MLGKKGVLLSLVLMVAIAVIFVWVYSHRKSDVALMYPQISQQSLVPLTQQVLQSRMKIIGYLDVRLQSEMGTLLALLPNSSYKELNLAEARGVGSDLISTSELEYPAVDPGCIGKFVEIDGVPIQQNGGLAISRIYSIRNVSLGEETTECLTNKPKPSSLAQGG